MGRRNIRRRNSRGYDQLFRIRKNAIAESDIIIILLPTGRGTHIEIGYSLALNKKIYLWSQDGKDFDVKDTVNFYYDKEVKRIVGGIEKLITEVEETVVGKKIKLDNHTRYFIGSLSSSVGRAKN